MQRTVKFECGKDANIDEILAEVFEQLKGGYNCNWSYSQHAKKLKEVGKAKSTNEAAGIISEQTGESKEAVRHKIREGEKVGDDRQETQQPEIIESEQEKGECELGYDKEIDDLCQQLKRRIRILQKTNWNWGMRNYVLDVVQNVALKAAKK